MKLAREQRKILYGLKRLFGVAITIAPKSTPSVNYQTGVQTLSSETSTTIRKAILGPAEWVETFAYDLTYIAAQRNFTYGGFFDQREMTIIIDLRDLSDYGDVEDDDVVTYDGDTYRVSDRRKGAAFVMFKVTRLANTDSE
jgi:hypothetical protein